MKRDHPLIAELAPLVGVERTLHDLHYALKVAARSVRAQVVGALHVTCSDETQFETTESFQTSFAADSLPRLKFAHRAPFLTTNLGARFEWDSLRVAEAHFAGAARTADPILTVVKISAHVGAGEPRRGLAVGKIDRYGTPSTSCGALAALLERARHPRGDELAETLRSEGVDRLELLRNEVASEHRALAAALVSARLQARSATLEAQDLTPTHPGLFLIVPAVTLNRATRDSEIVCGLYLIDRTGKGSPGWYRGLGDRPETYLIEHRHDHFLVRDEASAVTRPARDHRRLVGRARTQAHRAEAVRDDRIDRALAGARQAASPNPQLARALLKTAIAALAEVAPVPAALLLFSEGAAGIYHAYRAHRLVADVAGSDEARRLLHDLHEQVDQLPPQEVRKVLEVLLAEYGAS